MSHTDEQKELSVKVDKFLDTRIPILDQIYDLCLAIEKCGASPELTDAVTKAGALREPISELVRQALDLGIGEGIVSVSFSNSPKAEPGEVLPEEPKEQSGEGSKLCSGSAVGYSSTFADPNLIRELRECLGNHHIKSYGLRELVVARLAKELGGSVDDLKVNSDARQCANNCLKCLETKVLASSLGNLPAESPWESIPTQQILKYVGPVSFEYVCAIRAITDNNLDYWTCTISVNHAPEPTPSITQSGITEEVAFAAAIRTLKEIAYKNEWVLG
jgi:hypothetical protein